MKAQLVIILVVSALSLGAGALWSARGGLQAATVSDSQPSADIARALVGSWRGYGLFVRGNSIYRETAFFRFTDYGVIVGNVGQFVTIRGDYVVVGGAVMTSLENGNAMPHFLTNIRVTADRLEFIAPGTGSNMFGSHAGGGFVLTRE